MSLFIQNGGAHSPSASYRPKIKFIQCVDMLIFSFGFNDENIADASLSQTGYPIFLTRKLSVTNK